MRVFISIPITFIFFFLSTGSYAQGTVLLNSWQYLDSDSIYHEATISDSYVYIYTDEGDVTRHKSKIRGPKLSFDKNHWVVQQSDSSSVSVITNSGDTIRLYKL